MSNKLPVATASGPTAETPDAVKPLRVAIGAGVLAATYLLLLYLAHPLPGSLVALFGGAEDDLGRRGGMELVWMPPPGMSVEDVELRLEAAGTGAIVRQRGRDVLVIGVPGVTLENLSAVAARIGEGGGLAFHRVLQVDEMRRLAGVLGLPMRGELPIDLEIDQWQHDAGTTQTDYYLFGTSRDVVEAKVADAQQRGWTLPPGARIAYEYVGWADKRGWRSYVLEAQPALDGGAIANAVVSFEPHTNRPSVLLDFNRAGAERFAELTAELVGKKLAIVVDGEVKSAPVIHDRILGGQASITMGGSDPQDQLREAERLVAMLRLGALPKGGTVLATRHIEPVDDAPMQWMARIVIALAGGGLVALLVWVVVRVTRPVRRRGPAAASTERPWSRVLVTLLAPVAVYAVARISVLGVDAEELAFRAGATAGSLMGLFGEPTTLVSIGSLGIGPVINAFVVVELIAIVVPGWRRRRHTGPAARAPLAFAVGATVVTMVVVQGWFTTQYLGSLGDVLAPGMLSRVLVIASLLAGTLLLVAVAALIREHGLGNGFGAIVASGWLIGIVEVLDAGGLDTTMAVFLGSSLAVGVPLVIVMRWRIARIAEAPLRIPTSGIAPLGEVGGLVLLVTIVSAFQLDTLTMRLTEWTIVAGQQRWLLVALLAALTVLWSFAFARPGCTRALAQRVGLTAATPTTWWHATALSLALLLLVGATVALTSTLRPGAAGDPIWTAIIAIVLLDIYDDFRVRRVSLERVWSLQQPQFADLVSRSLAADGIPHHLASSHLRTALAFFGSFAPIDVLVPPEHAPAARAKLQELFSPA